MRRWSRRQLLKGSVGLAGLSLLGGCERAGPRTQQATPPPRIGVFAATSSAGTIAALGEIGYVDDQGAAIEARDASGKLELLPGLAAELVGLRPDVIVTVVVNLKTAHVLGPTIPRSVLQQATEVLH